MPMLKQYAPNFYRHSHYPQEAQDRIAAAFAAGKKVELEESQFSDPEDYDWSQIKIDGEPVPGTWLKGY